MATFADTASLPDHLQKMRVAEDSTKPFRPSFCGVLLFDGEYRTDNLIGPLPACPIPPPRPIVQGNHYSTCLFDTIREIRSVSLLARLPKMQAFVDRLGWHLLPTKEARDGIVIWYEEYFDDGTGDRYLYRYGAKNFVDKLPLHCIPYAIGPAPAEVSETSSAAASEESVEWAQESDEEDEEDEEPAFDDGSRDEDYYANLEELRLEPPPVDGDGAIRSSGYRFEAEKSIQTAMSIKYTLQLMRDKFERSVYKEVRQIAARTFCSAAEHDTDSYMFAMDTTCFAPATQGRFINGVKTQMDRGQWSVNPGVRYDTPKLERVEASFWHDWPAELLTGKALAASDTLLASSMRRRGDPPRIRVRCDDALRDA